MKIRKMVLLSIFICMSLGIYALESMIPPPVPFPGVKLGLANVITLISIYLIGRKEAFVILFVRILLSSVLFGQITSFWFSMAGGVLSFIVMALLSLVMDECNIWAISVFGALAHNAGQITVAILLTGQEGVLYYFLVMIISSVITGVFTGICSSLCLNRAKNIKIFKIHR